ncbi:hypothetical protein Pelo_13657 [Pelomyxa schiedti]|nr:hypothetical protein Pelo_13657 [Pelomyxa schiedti]
MTTTPSRVQYTRDQLEAMNTYNNNPDPSGEIQLLTSEMQRQLDLALEAFAEAQSNAKKIAFEAAATAMASSGGTSGLLPSPEATQSSTTNSDADNNRGSAPRSRYASPPQGSGGPPMGMGRGGTHFTHYEQTRPERGAGRAWPTRDHYSREDYDRVKPPPYVGSTSSAPPYHNNSWRRPWRTDGTGQEPSVPTSPNSSSIVDSSDIQLRPHRAINGVASPPLDDLQRKPRAATDSEKKTGDWESTDGRVENGPNTRRWEYPSSSSDGERERKEREARDLEEREKRERKEREDWERTERARIKQKVEEEMQESVQKLLLQEKEKLEAEMQQREAELRKMQEDIEKQKILAEENLKVQMMKQREEAERVERERIEKERAEKEIIEIIERERNEQETRERLEQERRDTEEMEERDRIAIERQMQQMHYQQQQQFMMHQHQQQLQHQQAQQRQMQQQQFQHQHLQQQQLHHQQLQQQQQELQRQQQQELQRQQQQQQQNYFRRIHSPPPPVQIPNEIMGLISPTENTAMYNATQPQAPNHMATYPSQYPPYSPPRSEKSEYNQPLTSWVPDPAITLMSGPKLDSFTPTWPMQSVQQPQQNLYSMQPPRPKDEGITPALAQILNTPIDNSGGYYNQTENAGQPAPPHPRFTVQVIRPPQAVRNYNTVTEEDREDQQRRQAQRDAAIRLIQQQQQREAEREAEREAAAAEAASYGGSVAWSAHESPLLRGIMERKSKDLARDYSPNNTVPLEYSEPSESPSTWGKPPSSAPNKTTEDDPRKKPKPKVDVTVQKKITSPTAPTKKKSEKPGGEMDAVKPSASEPDKAPKSWKITPKEAPPSLSEIQQEELVRKAAVELHSNNTSPVQPQQSTRQQPQVQVSKRTAPLSQHTTPSITAWSSTNQNQQPTREEFSPALGKGMKPVEKSVNDAVQLAPPGGEVIDWIHKWLSTVSPGTDFSHLVHTLSTVGSPSEVRYHVDTYLGSLPGGVAHEFSDKYLQKLQEQQQGDKKAKKPKAQQGPQKPKRGGNRTLVTDPSLLGFKYPKHTAVSSGNL